MESNFPSPLSGCAVYTGSDTKLALNSKIISSKFSTIEKSVNKFLLFYLGVMCLEVIVSTILKVVQESKVGYGELIQVSYNRSKCSPTICSRRLFRQALFFQGAEKKRRPSSLRAHLASPTTMLTGRSYFLEKVRQTLASVCCALTSIVCSSMPTWMSAGMNPRKSTMISMPSGPRAHSSGPARKQQNRGWHRQVETNLCPSFTWFGSLMRRVFEVDLQRRLLRLLRLQ